MRLFSISILSALSALACGNGSPSSDASRDSQADTQDSSVDSGGTDATHPATDAVVDSGDTDATDAVVDSDAKDAAHPETDVLADGGPPGPCASRSVSVSTFCIDDVTARAGETVNVNLYLLAAPGCTVLTQSNVQLTMPTGVTTETMALAGTDCRFVSRNSSTQAYAVGQLSSSASYGCPVALPIGLFRTLKLTVSSAMRVGTYPLALDAPTVGDNFTEQDCRNYPGGGSLPSAPAISGSLTIVP